MVIDFFDGVVGGVVVGGGAAEEPNGGDAEEVIGVVVAASVEAVGVVGVFVFVVEGEVGVLVVDFVDGGVEFGAEEVSGDQVEVIGWVAADHVEVEHSGDIFDGDRRLAGEEVRSHEAFFFAGEPAEDDRAFGSVDDEGLGDFEHGDATGGVVVGAVIDLTVADAEVVGVGADDDIFIFEDGVGAFEVGDDALGVCGSGLCFDIERDGFLGERLGGDL